MNTYFLNHQLITFCYFCASSLSCCLYKDGQTHTFFFFFFLAEPFESRSQAYCLRTRRKPGFLCSPASLVTGISYPIFNCSFMGTLLGYFPKVSFAIARLTPGWELMALGRRSQSQNFQAGSGCCVMTVTSPVGDGSYSCKTREEFNSANCSWRRNFSWLLRGPE